MGSLYFSYVCAAYASWAAVLLALALHTLYQWRQVTRELQAHD